LRETRPESQGDISLVVQLLSRLLYLSDFRDRSAEQKLNKGTGPIKKSFLLCNGRRTELHIFEIRMLAGNPLAVRKLFFQNSLAISFLIVGKVGPFSEILFKSKNDILSYK
jgi:hypothetical protein